jgi:hypothetical protein
VLLWPLPHFWQVPACLAQLNQLTALKLWGAYLKTSASSLVSLTSLQELRLLACKLEALAPNLATLLQLTSLE